MLPLEHLTVLDLTHARAGPTAVRLFSDWGADVIKIEQPVSGSGGGITGARRGPDEQNLHRNKRSLTLNLKDPKGHALFMRLATSADIIIENFKAEVKHRLKVDYETVRTVNPRLIYASISGFGQDGPYGKRAGVDQIIQGMSGLMSITGAPDQGPNRVGIAISDTTAGMFLGQGILLALLQREQTGAGQWVHTSLLEAMMCKLDFQGARYTMGGEIPEAQGNDHPYQTPMGTFTAADGLVNIAAPSQRLWERFCHALMHDESVDQSGAGAEPRQQAALALFEHTHYQRAGQRRETKEQLSADMNAVTGQFTVAELVAKLNAVGVPCGPINNIGQAFDDEQVQHLQMVKPAPHHELGALNLIRSPISLSAAPQPNQFRNAAPDPGADCDTILSELGLSSTEIAELRDHQVI